MLFYCIRGINLRDLFFFSPGIGRLYSRRRGSLKNTRSLAHNDSDREKNSILIKFKSTIIEKLRARQSSVGKAGIARKLQPIKLIRVLHHPSGNSKKIFNSTPALAAAAAACHSRGAAALGVTGA